MLERVNEILSGPGAPDRDKGGNEKRMSSRSGPRTAATGRHVTIKDLAHELGVSITTVSRALNGYSDVGEATRERVFAAARRTGYRPNRNAQRLVAQRTHSLGWVRLDGEGHFADPHFVEVFAGALRTCRDHDYDMVFAAAPTGADAPVYDRYVHNKSVDGFILELPQPDDARISLLLETDVPFVVHGRESRSARYSWVDIDNRGIFKTLAGVLLDSGHTRIGLINGDERFTYALERRIGVQEALSERGLPASGVKAVNAPHPMGLSGFELTDRLIEDGGITAIIYSSAVMALEGQGALTRRGLRPGVDIAIATMHDELRYVDISPYDEVFAFARSSLREAGQALAATLIRCCEGDGEPAGTLVPATFHFPAGMNTRCATSLVADAPQTEGLPS